MLVIVGATTSFTARITRAAVPMLPAASAADASKVSVSPVCALWGIVTVNEVAADACAGLTSRA